MFPLRTCDPLSKIPLPEDMISLASLQICPDETLGVRPNYTQMGKVSRQVEIFRGVSRCHQVAPTPQPMAYPAQKNLCLEPSGMP